MKKLLVIYIYSILLFSFIACSEKSKISSNKVYSKQSTLEKAEKYFEELDKEAEKNPEDFTLLEKSPKQEEKKEVKKYLPPSKSKFKVNTKYPLKKGYPVWVYNPNYNGYLGAVGIAKKIRGKGYPEQKRLAVMIAKANLAKQIRLIINSEVYTEKMRISKKDYEDYKSKLYSLSKQSSHAYLKYVVVKDEWIDPKTGDLYVWVVLEKH